jgi:hypothetical protein
VTGAPSGRVQEGTLTLTVAGRGTRSVPASVPASPEACRISYAGEGTGPVRRTMVMVVPRPQREHAQWRRPGTRWARRAATGRLAGPAGWTR